MYEMADQSWRSQPKRMGRATLKAISRRIAEYVLQYQLPSIKVVLHGGEPLMAGAEMLAKAAELIRGSVPSSTDVQIAVQTNGFFLDERMLQVLHSHDIKIGISLDGGVAANDRHRRKKDGTGSYAQIADALHLLDCKEYRAIFAGVICVVDLENDPMETYESLVEFRPPAIDFLLPHGNWSRSPPQRRPDVADEPYGRWLATIFDRWYSANTPEPGIRFFEEILNLSLGGASRVETVGLTPVGLLVIDTNGSIEQTDALRSSYSGASALGLNVMSNSLDEAIAHPGIVARQIGIEALSRTCRECAVVNVCGGGFYPHRYRAGHGYRNPSVYCRDLRYLIEHIIQRVQQDVRHIIQDQPC
jgi:uncharacterized protein